MKIHTEKQGDILVARVLEKWLDAQFATEFKEKMINLIEAGNRLVVMDFSQVEFVDSSGLGAIISCLKHLGRDGNIVLCGISGEVMELFKLTRMNRVFQIEKNTDEAISWISTSHPG